ncbi:CBS domain-containing protein [Vulcanisaeta souniana]|uniref:Histidine kinase n=2 Tax=Vulcanisaeta souniana TaxID=164452 RepID=A0A830E1F5_9CREN|nr:CBS domain-containing protein [Vulcanisaeta souniana]BDR93430.1 histidine kinase [Vulcanisaeta souniana JCM 11219]GGI77048.1 histidine kinase [Vulcanisaeta souniana JCM 11219]
MVDVRAIDMVRKKPLVITEDKPFIEAVDLMAKENTGSVVIVEDLNSMKLRGIITERDVIRALANRLPLDTPVGKVGTMGPRVVRARVDDPISAVASLMVNYRVRHVIVVDENDVVVGVISIRDLLGDLEAVREVARLDRYPKVRE